MCVVAGAGFVVLPDHVVKNPASLAQALATHRVTHLTAVPTLLHALIPYLTPAPHSPRGKPCHEQSSPEEMRPPTNAWPSNHRYLPVEPSDRREAAAFDACSERPRAVASEPFPARQYPVACDTFSERHRVDALDSSSGRHRAVGDDTVPERQNPVASNTFSERQRAIAFDIISKRQRADAVDSSSERHRAVVGDAMLRLRVVASSGEPLTTALAQTLIPLLPPGCCLLNLYGSTEAAADCTCFDASTCHWGSHDVSSVPDASLHAGFLTKSVAASHDTDVQAATSAPLAQNTQHALTSSQSGQQPAASALLPDAAWPAPGTLATAASMAASRQDVVTASGRSDDHTAPAPIGLPPYPSQDPLTHNTKVAVGWPLDGFAVCILDMTTGLQEEEKLPVKLPGKQAECSSSSFDSTIAQQVSEHPSPHGLSQAKKRKIDLTGSMSEAGPSESLETAETGMANHMADELARSVVSIVEAGEVGEVAVAGTGLALGYHRYGRMLGFQTLDRPLV